MVGRWPGGFAPRAFAILSIIFGRAYANDTIGPEVLSYSNFICGEIVTNCEIAGNVPYGPDIWTYKRYNFWNNFKYKQIQRGFFNRSACDQDNAWMELVYNGTWEDRGVHADSTEENPVSLISIYVNNVTLVSWYDEVCIDTAGGSVKCIDTIGAIGNMCPCNGWDWSLDVNSSEPRSRDVRLHCMPHSQCPVVQDVYVEKIHYFAYNATPASICTSEANTDKNRGWNRFRDEATCWRKQSQTQCRARSSSPSRNSAFSTYITAIAVAMAIKMTD